MEIGGILGIFYIVYLLLQKSLFNDRRRFIKFFVYTFKKKKASTRNFSGDVMDENSY